MNISYYTDPGHGWAACKIETLRSLGIVGQISHYSYMRGRTAYLEEDCDFARLLDALAAAGVEYTIVEKHTNKRSPIRSYSTYKVAA
jgi:sugar phosphate isomerase/epimerase